MRRRYTSFLIFLLAVLHPSCMEERLIRVYGDQQTWHRLTISVRGPDLDEQSFPNPFLDYRLSARFTKGNQAIDVPGYFAADGEAAETGASSGTTWKLHFSPPEAGTWNYMISFRKGRAISLSDDPGEGDPLAADGMTGTIVVEETSKTGNDFRARGRLATSGSRYLQHMGTGEYFLKGGADSPENFLAYRDFDGTYYGGNSVQRSGEDAPNEGLHGFGAHAMDWKEGDPTWQDGKGKGMIGALNYLASKGMNSVYFLTLNILGDGEDVWPYTDRNERYRFDCSKLDQWEIVFSHMESLGIMMHVVLQETENEQVLDGGYLDVQRKLYLRELVARFSHHNAITWNLGEEHGPMEWMEYAQSLEDTWKMAAYLRSLDPYDHPIVVHTNAAEKPRNEYISNYLGNPLLDGLSVQEGNPRLVHATTLKWIDASRASGRQWIVCLDEIGPYWKGALPDAADPDHDTIRTEVLWGNLMAGGGGVEWYFGYRFPHADLNCEDWRSRDKLWDQTFHALDFFRRYLPFHDMENMDDLCRTGYCFAKPGEMYVLFSTWNERNTLDLAGESGQYSVEWYDPRKGGELQQGSMAEVSAGSAISPGSPPYDPSKDWVCLLRKVND